MFMGKSINYLNPKVSIIIPTYNRPHLAGRAIKSVLNQTHQNFEIILVDDSPNNDTKEVVKQLKDERIKYIKSEDIKRGSAAARKRNLGIRNISQDSKYIAFLDDDDEFLPTFLEETLKKLEQENEVVAVGVYGESRLEDGRKLKRRYPLREFWETRLGNGSVLRREIFEKENIWFDEKTLFEDLDFGVRVAKNHKVGFIPKILRVYYIYPSKKGESSSTKYERQADNLGYFFKKNQDIYFAAGKRAFGFLNFLAGKIYCQAGRIREGRFHFKKALKTDFKLKYFLYYLIALFFPKVFQSHRILILKYKILGNL